MPRLPKGLFHREGRGYYTRKWVNGKDRWVALGRDLEDAKRKLRELNRSGPVLATRATVNELAREWLDGRVAVRRTAEGLQKAESRVGLYLSAFRGSSWWARSRRRTCGSTGAGWRRTNGR